MTTTWCTSPHVVAALERAAGSWTFGGRDRLAVQRRGRLAIVPIRGVLGTTLGPSVAAIRDAVRGAVRGGANAIMLDIDSHGGTTQGVPGLADELRGLRKRGVRVHALVDGGTAAGSAYWLATGAERIHASRSSQVGGVGLYQVVEDSHRLYESKGIDVHVIRSGRHKGVGAGGARLDLDQVAEIERGVRDLFGIFAEDVRRARSLDDAGLARVSDGRTWIATRARELGLVDQVVTRDKAIALASRS